jgi:hypothetical protein
LCIGILTDTRAFLSPLAGIFECHSALIRWAERLVNRFDSVGHLPGMVDEVNPLDGGSMLLIKMLRADSMVLTKFFRVI